MSRRAAIVTAVLAGPEQVFRVTLTRPVANFGVVITRREPGVKVEPRIVEDGDENRLTGYAALPTNLNPYLDAVRQSGARGRGDPAARRQLRRRLRQRHRSRAPARSPSASGSTTRSRRLSGSRRLASAATSPSSFAPRISARASTQRRSAPRSTAGRARRPWSRARCGSGRRASSPASTGSGSRRPTTRSRATWRTCRRSCPTRACCRPRS